MRKLVSSAPSHYGSSRNSNNNNGRRTTRWTWTTMLGAMSGICVLVAAVQLLVSHQKVINASQGLSSTSFTELVMSDWVAGSEQLTMKQQHNIDNERQPRQQPSPPSSSQKTVVKTTTSLNELKQQQRQQQKAKTTTLVGNSGAGLETPKENGAKPKATDGKFNEIEEDPNRPSVLCAECWEIVKKAPRVNLTYVDVSNGHVDHPHKGAQYPNNPNQYGFVYDVTTLHRHPVPLEISDSKKQVLCAIKDDNYHALKKIRLAREYLPKDEKNDLTPAKDGIKLLCAIYSAEPFHNKLFNVRETWASRCDGFFVASNRTDERYNAVGIDHQGLEEYKNMWQKVRSIWAYIYDNYYNDYDWFHLGGDDMWVIVENLRQYLNSVEIQTAANGGQTVTTTTTLDNPPQFQTPLFLGCRFYYSRTGFFNTGGPGYTINKAALKLLVTKGLVELEQSAKVSMEDVKVSKVFKAMGVDPYPTQDAFGSERYHHMTPGRYYSNKLPPWYIMATKQIKKNFGKDHSSTQSFAFHQLKGDDMKRFHMQIYGLCK